MYENDNELEIYDSCEFSIRSLKNTRFKKYLAKISGEDPFFGLARHFLSYQSVTRGGGNVRYKYGKVPDGVYETSVKYFDKDSNQPFITDRKLCLIWDGSCFNYNYSRFNKQEILGFVDAFASGGFHCSMLPDD